MFTGLTKQVYMGIENYGYGFLVRDNIRDYTKLQEAPLCPLLRVFHQATIDCSSYDI